MSMSDKVHRNKSKKHSEESKKKMSETISGEKVPWYGKHLSKETRRKISETKKSQILAEEQRKKQS